MSQDKEWYRLPNGDYTRSMKRYFTAYRKLAKPIAKSIGYAISAYDPGILLCKPGYKSFSLDSNVAISFYESITGKKFTC